MKVLKLPESPWPIVAKCRTCNTEVELSKSDVTRNNDPHPMTESWDFWKCPTCGDNCPIVLPKNARFT